jgi:hypothetical protein
MVEAGLADQYARGPVAYRKLVSAWSEAGQLYLERAEFIDLGDRLVLLADMSLRWSRLADTPLSREWADVITLVNGRIIREQYYWDHAEALEAVGAPEPAGSSDAKLDPSRRPAPWKQWLR